MCMRERKQVSKFHFDFDLDINVYHNIILILLSFSNLQNLSSHEPFGSCRYNHNELNMDGNIMLWDSFGFYKFQH